MRYDKAALTFEDQASRLIDRGLGSDPEELIRRLQAVSYYRLSGYLYPFRISESDRYLPGTTLTEVWRRYCFDRRLRVLMLDAIERIEVAVRTQLLYQFSHKYGAFGHCHEDNLPNLKVKDYITWREALRAETDLPHEPLAGTRRNSLFRISLHSGIRDGPPRGLEKPSPLAKLLIVHS